MRIHQNQQNRTDHLCSKCNRQIENNERYWRDDAADIVCFECTPDDGIGGKQIQYDNSGIGHNWRDIDAVDIPADVRTEIEGEIIDGNLETCSNFTASNGLHYRW